MALTPIDPMLEMNHNTSAYSAYQASGFPANFTGTSYTSTTTTVAVNTALVDDSMNPVTPAHVSANSVKALVPNYTGKWYAHLVPWFGSSSHINIGVNCHDPQWTVAMLTDVSNRGFDGVIIDWYGQGSFEDGSTLLIQQHVPNYPTLTYAIMVDQGSYGTTAQLEAHLSYIHTQYFSDPHYQTYNGMPVVFFFGTIAGVDYATAKASIGQSMFWIFEGPGAQSSSYVDGTFGWPSPFSSGINPSDPYNLAADTSYLTQVAGGKPAVPHVSPGFNGTLTKSISWSLGKYLPRDSGECWLAKCANLNTHIPSNVIGIQCATWNDWEEGSQIESPIQNDLIVTASLSGSTFQWAVSGGTGNESTLTGYRVIAAEGGSAWLISTVAAGGAKSIDLSTLGLQVGTTYSVYVVAVGVGSVRNQISNTVSYTVPTPPQPPSGGANDKYKWIRFADARQQLANRLADPGNLFWTDAENGLYLIEALRVWNALTEVWNEDFPFTQTVAAKWYNLATMAGSPRIRTVTDSDLYTLMQYHLLEPPSGGAWTGTTQFTMDMLRGALQRRSDEIIQLSGSNLTQLEPINMTPLVRTYPLDDTVLEPRRTRYLPIAPGFGYVLARDDHWAWDRFEPYHELSPGTPVSWGVIQGPPLTVAVDFPPDVPALLDIIALMSGPTFAPPASTVMAIPDDWTWVAKWGAMADLLAQESETTDNPRAQFCQQRYLDGLKAMIASNWLVLGRINGLPVDTPALAEMDHYAPDWEIDPNAWPSVVVAGMDFLAPCPVMTWPTDIQGVLVRVVANAPVPVANDDYVQVSRDTFDAILNYAQAIAMFKQGGAEFAAGTQLLQQFAMAVIETNSRLANMGLFPDVMKTQGKRQDVIVERIT